MSKNNESTAESKNSMPSYINWFIKDSSGLKRGGTAPIMQSRRNRPTLGANIAGTPGGQEPVIIRAGFGSKNDISPALQQNEGSISELKSLQSLDAEGTKITKIQNGAGVSTYRLTLKKNSDEAARQLPDNNLEPTSSKTGKSQLLSTSVQKTTDGRNHSLFNQLENMLDEPSEPADITANLTNLDILEKNIAVRPGSSHCKGGPGFRRNRILNESLQNPEEFQTPNTGNLDLESLNNLNDLIVQLDSPDKRGQNLDTSDLRMTQNGSTENKARPWSRQGLQSRESENGAFPKYSKMARMLQKGSMKDNQIVVQNFKEDAGTGIYERNNETRSKKDTNDSNPFKVKQMFESRKFVEDDLQAFNASDDEDEPKGEPMMFKKHSRDPGYGVDRQNESHKENLVSMIGRNFHDNSHNKRPDDDEEIDGGLAMQRFQAERPPARKNYQAMNLDDRYSFQHSDKKPTTNTSVNQSQQLAVVRPPSRHKIPSKALGLDLPSEPNRGGNERGQEYEVENNIIKRDIVSRKGNALKVGDSGFHFEEKEFENMNFNKVLDFSDFLDGEETPKVLQSNNTSVRPGSSNINQRRNIQTASGSKPQQLETNPRQLGIHSAKGRSGLTGPITNSKADPFDNLRPAMSKQESRGDKQYNPFNNGYKSKGQTQFNHDVDACDILNVDSDSDESDIFSQRQNYSQMSNSISRANTSNKNRDPNKVPKNNFLNQGPGIHKDKKSEIVFVYNKEAAKVKKENVDLPFETTLGKDFVGLFAN